MKVINVGVFVNISIAAVAVFLLYVVSSISLILGISLLTFTIFLLIPKKNPIVAYGFFLACFFQNFFISLCSPLIVNDLYFKVLHSFNFIIPILFLVWQIVVKRKIINERKLLSLDACLLFIILIYFVFGMYNYGLLPSAMYLRLFISPILFFWLGYYMLYYVEAERFEVAIMIVLVFLAVVTLAGVLFPVIFLSTINADTYYSLRYQSEDGFDAEGVMTLYRSNLFNSNFFTTIQTFRFGSILNNSISFAYLATILSFVAITRRKFLLAGLMIVVVVVSSFSKGALLFLITTLFIILLRKKVKFSFVILLLLLVPIWILIIVVGYKTSNEHIIGFVEGSKYLWDTPFGNGLGFGGNLSPIRLTRLNGVPLDAGYWSRFQNGSESVFGVLFSSLGILGLVFSFLFVWRINIVYRILFLEIKSRIWGILMLIIFFQGIFQEEAFSPYAFGLVMFISGFNFHQVKQKLHENF